VLRAARAVLPEPSLDEAEGLRSSGSAGTLLVRYHKDPDGVTNYG
jgi:hypothetical protein